MEKHFVQSENWIKYKKEYGTPGYNINNIAFTTHKIPYTPFCYGYSPKVNPLDIKWDGLEQTLKETLPNLIALNFDIPNIIEGSTDEKSATDTLEKHCVRAPRNTFSKGNVLLDLTKTESELFTQLESKHRYNIRLAEKKGVTLKIAETDEDFDLFWRVFENTAKRQKFYIRNKEFYKGVWTFFKKMNEADILIAMHEDTVLAAWMLLIHNKTLYYPYGGSSYDKRNLQGSTFLGWQAIKYGKKKGCELFDMWGASENPNDTKDEYFGFTDFKMKFGGKHVTYIASYDLILNKPVYYLFNLVNKIRWFILRIIK